MFPFASDCLEGEDDDDEVLVLPPEPKKPVLVIDLEPPSPEHSDISSSIGDSGLVMPNEESREVSALKQCELDIQLYKSKHLLFAEL